MQIKIPTTAQRIRRLSYYSLGLVLASGPLVHGQDDADEVFELSPFTINADENVGYRATSTLAGTRIKTDLKDLGSAIQVVTAEFMEDTGATGVEDLLLYTTGTEVGGPDGNFSGTTLDSGTLFNDDEARRNPQSGARVRGVATPNYTRNYFSTNIPVDGYNTSGITISRGPNSLLFGLGSPGGVVDNSVKMPVVGENSNKITFRFGSHGSNRATFDTVQTVIEDRLAIKVSGLYDEKKYRQDPARDVNKRLYFAFSGVLRKGQEDSFFGSTTVRGNIEAGEGERTPPASIVPGVSYESFFQAPKDFRPYNAVDYPGPGYDGLAATWSKWGTLDTRLQPDGTPGYNENSTVPGEWDVYSTPFFFTSPMTIFQPDGAVSLYPTGSAPEGLEALGGFANWSNNQATPNGGSHRPDLFVNTRGYEEGAQGLGFKSPSLSSRDIFDYRNNLLTGNLQKVSSEFDAQTVFLEQSFHNNRGGIEIALDKQTYETSYYQPFGGGGRSQAIYIDTTEYLIGEIPNPNVGRAFVTNYYTFDSDSVETTERDNKRLTAFYEFDFNDVNDNLGKVLGKHRVTALAQTEDRNSYNATYGKFIDGVGFEIRGGDDVGWGRQVAPVYYISDDLRGVEMENVRLSAIPSNTIQDVGRFQARYLLDPNDSSLGSEDRDFRVVRRARDANANALEVESQAFAWQSYFLDNHVIGLVGLRTDEVTTYGRMSNDDLEAIYGDEPGRNPDRFPGGEVDIARRQMLRTPDADDVQSADTATYSVVAHIPQKWVDKTPVSSMSLHWSSSENFQAISQGRDHYNTPIGNPAGETTEYGFSLGFGEDRWLLRVNHFETSSKNVRTAGGLPGDSMGQIRSFADKWYQGIVDEVPWGVDSPSLGASRAAQFGYAGFQEVVDDIVTLIPDHLVDLYDLRLDPERNTYEFMGEGIQGLIATQEIESEGWEIELVGNPTNNWRVSMNITKLEATPTNTAQALQEHSESVLNRMNELSFDNPLILEGPQSIVGIHERWSQQIATPVAGLRARDDTNSQELREWRVNAVTNYSFSEGKFRGFSVGGALRYQSKVGIGNALTFNENGVPVPDVNRIFYGDSELNGDLWASYKKRLGDKVDWKIQLNVRNAIGADGNDIPLFANPDGERRLFRVAPETSWFVTNSFSF